MEITMTKPLIPASAPSKFGKGIFDEDIMRAYEVHYRPSAGETFADDEGALSNLPNWYALNQSEFFTKACIKCGGDGTHWAEHIEDGVCFRCGGSGLMPRVGHKTAHQLDLMVKAARRAEEKRLAEERIALAKRRDRDHAYALKINESFDKKVPQEFLAEEGTKVKVTGEIVFRKEIEGVYGTSTMLIIRVSESVSVKLFGTSAWLNEWDEEVVRKWEAEEAAAIAEGRDPETIYSQGSYLEKLIARKGNTVTITGTVKKNEEYKGDKSSVLTRTKLVQEKN